MGASHIERSGWKLLRGPQSKKWSNPEPARGRQNQGEHSFSLFQKTTGSDHLVRKRGVAGPPLSILDLGRGWGGIRAQRGEKAGRYGFFSPNRFFPEAAEPWGGATVKSQKPLKEQEGHGVAKNPEIPARAPTAKSALPETPPPAVD